VKSLIIYSSRTENTRKLAQSIYDTLSGAKELVSIENVPSPDADYNLVAVGFPSSPEKKRFGTCCFGLDLDTAIAETVLHDEKPDRGTFRIAYTVIESRHLSRFKPDTLKLANLTGVALKIPGGHGSLSTITPCRLPQLRARAVYRHPQLVDGIY
jgi:hypothetical protein